MRRGSMRRLLIAACLLAPVVTLSGGEPTARPVAVLHLRAVGPEGESLGEYLMADDHQATPPAVLGLVETTEGFRARLRFSLDHDLGIATQSFIDLSSGWSVELRHDFGMRNLGRPEDHYDGMQWLAAVQERQKRERPISTFTIATSDGSRAEWNETWGAPAEVGEEAEAQALADLAAGLAKEELPASARAELELLGALLASSEGGRLSTFDDLLERTLRALRAGRGTGDKADEMEIRVDSAPARERPERSAHLLGMLDRGEREGASSQEKGAGDPR